MTFFNIMSIVIVNGIKLMGFLVFASLFIEGKYHMNSFSLMASNAISTHGGQKYGQVLWGI
jgi:hypothetical protein